MRDLRIVHVAVLEERFEPIELGHFSEIQSRLNSCLQIVSLYELRMLPGDQDEMYMFRQLPRLTGLLRKPTKLSCLTFG